MRTTLILLVSLTIAGCCSLQKCEEKVGKCEEQVQIVPGAPVKVFLDPGHIAVPEPFELQAEKWTPEQIEEDPVGYEEALWNDLLVLVDRDINITDYLKRLEALRLRMISEANGGN